jgi:putative heme-binding domain-containing protein
MHPSSDIVDQYQDTEVWTSAGPVYVGTVVSEDESTLRLLVAGAPPETVEIEKADVELRRPSPLSKMPEGLLEVLTVDEIRDLFAFLLRR